MSAHQRQSSTVACRCGAVVLQASGPPIAHAACYCASCQEAGRRMEQLPGAAPVLDADGGTDYVLYRKDRVRVVQGAERMQSLRLKPDSPTRRLVATCCNSALFLDFTKGHWLTLYRARVAGPVQPLEMRVMTSAKPDGVVLPSDVPNYPTHSGKLMGRLLAAWIRMGFRIPKVDGAPV